MTNRWLKAMLATGLTALSAHAMAHAHLKSASPRAGSTLRIAPTQVALEFSETLEAAFSAIEVRNAAGDWVDNEQSTLAAKNARRLSVGMRPIPPGTYKVIWHVTSVDAHRTEGSFAFTVAAAK